MQKGLGLVRRDCDMELTLVFDGQALHSKFHVGWGFSCYLHGVGLLFDTGEDGPKLLHNLEVLSIPLNEIHGLFLSCEHFEHAGGIWGVIQRNPKISLFLPESISEEFKEQVDSLGSKIIQGNGHGSLFPGIYSIEETCTRMPEQSLVIDGDRGLVVLCGCAHCGIDRPVRRVAGEFSSKIDLVVGGFHLFDSSQKKIEQVIESFQALGIHRVAPCHCTGPRARMMFNEAYEDQFIDLVVGSRIQI
jgi:7,8-dihydropterin-6-yl-methyl-4-(beta-D-ribofuranosyl)aminobenzene 5'-phosphate synthase